MSGVDEAQWVALYRELEKPLYNVVFRWSWDAAESQDVVQEAFLRCWRTRARIRPEGFKAFVYQTALNLASNQRRRNKLWRFVSWSAIEEPRDANASQAQFLSPPMIEAVDALPEDLKRVLLLTEIAGMSYREIAEVMNVKEGTVGSRRNRALALVRERLQTSGIEFDEG
jgi:RNA polymerase sigma-70 factor (ECF subfamily)